MPRPLRSRKWRRCWTPPRRWCAGNSRRAGVAGGRVAKAQGGGCRNGALRRKAAQGVSSSARMRRSKRRRLVEAWEFLQERPRLLFVDVVVKQAFELAKRNGVAPEQAAVRIERHVLPVRCGKGACGCGIRGHHAQGVDALHDKEKVVLAQRGGGRRGDVLPAGILPAGRPRRVAARRVVLLADAALRRGAASPAGCVRRATLRLRYPPLCRSLPRRSARNLLPPRSPSPPVR